MDDVFRHLMAVTLVLSVQMRALVASDPGFAGQEPESRADEPHGDSIAHCFDSGTRDLSLIESPCRKSDPEKCDLSPRPFTLPHLVSPKIPNAKSISTIELPAKPNCAL